MSHMGQARTSAHVRAWSVHPSTTDMRAPWRHVRLVPATDIVRRAGSGYASIVLAPPQPCFRYGRRLVALGALHAVFYPVERFYARRRIDAFGGEVLDVDKIDPLKVRIIFGAADGNRLDRLR